jgi:hypothetical protein
VNREELYGLPGDEFVGARGALARSLAKGKQRDEAAAVKKLRRPTRSAEVLNHLARSEPKAIAKLTAAGDALRKALEAGKRDGVDAARRDVSAAVDVLLEAARAEGPSEQALAEVATSLQAAAADTGSGERLREGCLDRPLDPPGFEALAGLTLQPSDRKAGEGKAKEKAKAKGPPPPTAAERAAAQQRGRLVRRVEIARAELDRAEEAHRAAEAALAEWDDAEA